jgi:2-hydroxychromene-2-carboxylate isomerase
MLGFHSTTGRFAIAAIIVAVAAGLSCCKPPPQRGKGPGPGEEAGAGIENKAKVEFYVMSQCPYGTQVQEGIGPVLEKRKGYIAFTEDFIATPTPEGALNCMHGEAECNGNRAELCLAKHYPDTYFPAVLCMAKDRQGIPDNWKKCAEEAGLDPAPVKACYDGDEGKSLAQASAMKSQEKGARGSPTIFINDKPYRGGRSPEAFDIAVCMALDEKDRPSDCPEVKEVDLTIISDKRCKECGVRAQSMKTQFENMFMKLNVHELDWTDEAAKDIIEKAQVKLLPAYVFHGNVKDDPGWEQISRHVEAVGGYFAILPDRVRSTFDPTKEVCDNGEDDTGNGLVDCKDPDCKYAQVCRENCTDGKDNTGNGLVDCKDPDCAKHVACMENCEDGQDNTGNGLVDCKDPDCKERLVCRKEIPKKLDLFVMSNCPYGIKAGNALEEVLANFGPELKFKMHYITSVFDEAGYQDYPRKEWCTQLEDGKWYCSMHREGETQENLRQICAQELFPSKFMSYVLCRNKNIRDENWQACTTEAGIDEAKLTACATGEQGRKLLQSDSDLCDMVNVHGSPTYMWNNKTIERASPDPESVKTIFCKHNEGTPGCEKTLSGPEDQPQGAAPPGSCG